MWGVPPDSAHPALPPGQTVAGGKKKYEALAAWGHLEEVGREAEKAGFHFSILCPVGVMKPLTALIPSGINCIPDTATGS